MKYLAVLVVSNQSVWTEAVEVVDGIDGAKKFYNTKSDNQKPHWDDIEIRFFPFQEPQRVIDRFTRQMPFGDGTYFDDGGFTHYIRDYEEIDISQMEEFERTGYYKPSYGRCKRCGLEHWAEAVPVNRCKCVADGDIGYTSISN